MAGTLCISRITINLELCQDLAPTSQNSVNPARKCLRRFCCFKVVHHISTKDRSSVWSIFRLREILRSTEILRLWMHGSSNYPNVPPLKIAYQNFRMMERYPNDKELHRITKQEIQKKSRDNARTPMQVSWLICFKIFDFTSHNYVQWNTSAHAGFSTTTPWQRENESYTTINAEAQVGIPGSVFEYWASILKLRKTHIDVFVYGSFVLINDGHQDVFAYLRTFEKETALVVCNFKKETVVWDLPKGFCWKDAEALVGNYDYDGKIVLEGGKVELRPFEAFVVFVREIARAWRWEGIWKVMQEVCNLQISVTNLLSRILSWLILPSNGFSSWLRYFDNQNIIPSYFAGNRSSRDSITTIMKETLSFQPGRNDYEKFALLDKVVQKHTARG